MSFIDSACITVHSGHGGPGKTGFRREKYIPKGGPDGGDGGVGGHVILIADQNLQTLLDFQLKKKFTASNGEAGGKKNKSGKAGQNEIIRVPCGTLVFDQADTLLVDLKEAEQSFIVVKGGKGGRGNQHFATPKNRIPTYSQAGLPGHSKTIKLELRLLAEVGLIGLPNAGKSTLLKTLTATNPKIGAYPFTTLHPNLGVLRWFDKEVVIADIPGIIEGASAGKGLGASFLKHVDRTQVLIHLIEVEENPDDCVKKFKSIQNELKKSRYQLSEKPHYIVLTKIELIDSDCLNTTIEKLSKHIKKDILTISSHTHYGIDLLIKKLYTWVT